MPNHSSKKIPSHPIPDAALDADIAILGKKGRGKTYTAKGVVERLLELNRRVLILDPLSVWWGLRSSKDGQKPGFPIAVFGGPHADVPISADSGRALASILANENLPAVIDLGRMRRNEQNQLVADLLDELFIQNREALTIVLEEADVFAPQKSAKDDSSRVLHEVLRIALRGRAYGFRLISITQRPAKLNKDVLTQLSVLAVLGMTSPQDRDAIKEWVDGNADRDQGKAVYESLASLQVGEGWIWAPEHNILEKVKFPSIKTLDTSFTPKAGEKIILPKTLAQVDVTGLQKALDSVQNHKQQKALPQVDLEAIKQQAFQEGFDTGFLKGKTEGRSEVQKQLMNFLEKEAPPVLNKPQRAVSEEAPQPKARPVARKPSAENPGLNSGMRRALSALVSSNPASLSESQWATLAGFKRTSGTWGTYKSKLKMLNFIAVDGKQWKATEQGIEALGGNIESIPKQPLERVLYWSSKVGAAGKLLQALADNYPTLMTKSELADYLGMSATSGTFNTYLSKLRSNELIDVEGNKLTASKNLMKA